MIDCVGRVFQLCVRARFLSPTSWHYTPVQPQSLQVAASPFSWGPGSLLFSFMSFQPFAPPPSITRLFAYDDPVS